MGAAFRFKNNIQYIVMPANVNPEESAAIRLKLDQKISQHRNHFLFDLAELDLTDKASLLSVLLVLLWFVLVRCPRYEIQRVVRRCLSPGEQERRGETRRVQLRVKTQRGQTTI